MRLAYTMCIGVCVFTWPPWWGYYMLFEKYHSYMDYKRNTIYVYGCDSIFVLERQEQEKGRWKKEKRDGGSAVFIPFLREVSTVRVKPNNTV